MVQLQNARLKRGGSGFDTRSSYTKDFLLQKWCMLFPYLAFSTLRKSMGVKYTVLPDGQPLNLPITVLAKLYEPMANATEMGTAYSPKMAREATLNSFTLKSLRYP